MAYSNVGAAIFTLRNADKTTSGDIGRLPVTIGQSTTVVKAVTQLDNPLSKALSKGLNYIGSDKVVSKLGKAAKFASDNVNPLIVASSGLKVALADKEDRKKTLITESGCLAGMFLGEGLMKKHLDKILEKTSIGKKWLPVVKGIVFVTGSITASTIGQKIGKKVAQYWDKPLVKTEQKENIQNNSQKAYTPINIKA